MRFYRVYELDQMDSIEDIRLIQAVDGAEALEQAQAAAGAGATVEVWDQRRLIGRAILQTPSIAPMAVPAAEGRSARSPLG